MRTMTTILLALLCLATACDETGNASEEDLGSGDTAPTDDTGADTVGPADTDAGDAGDTVDTSDTVDTVDLDTTAAPCEGPLRISPDTVGSAGGELVYVEGHEFYIGALEWFFAVDGQVAVAPDYQPAGEQPPGPCRLTFRLPPLPPGDYPVSVYYGTPDSPMNPEPNGLVLHVTAADGPWSGGGACDLGQTCAEGQHCELGLGLCAWDGCGWSACAADGHVCDMTQGCIPQPSACTTGADCAVLYSECGCLAVPGDDPRLALPRPQLTACELGGCESCEMNRCDTQAFWANCNPDTGGCFLMPPL